MTTLFFFPPCFRGKPACFSVHCGLCLSLSKINNWQHKTAKAGAYCTKPVDRYTGLQNSPHFIIICGRPTQSSVQLLTHIRLYKTEQCCVQKYSSLETILCGTMFCGCNSCKYFGACLHQFGTSRGWNYFPFFLAKQLKIRLLTAVFGSFHRFSIVFRPGLPSVYGFWQTANGTLWFSFSNMI